MVRSSFPFGLSQYKEGRVGGGVGGGGGDGSLMAGLQPRCALYLQCAEVPVPSAVLVCPKPPAS